MSQKISIKLTGSIFSEIKSEKELIVPITENLTAKLKWHPASTGKINYTIRGNIGFTESWKLISLLEEKLESILAWLSFSYNCRVHEPLTTELITYTENRQLEKIFTLHLPRNPQHFVSGKGKINIKKKRLLFEKGIKTILTEIPLPLLLYRKALIEPSIPASFWNLYSIFQILVGERTNIDKYLQDNYKMKLVNNDHENVKRSIFIAIRDSFSHPNGTFDGKKLDLDKELSKNMDTFFVITNKVIIRKLNFDKLIK